MQVKWENIDNLLYAKTVTFSSADVYTHVQVLFCNRFGEERNALDNVSHVLFCFYAEIMLDTWLH